MIYAKSALYLFFILSSRSVLRTRGTRIIGITIGTTRVLEGVTVMTSSDTILMVTLEFEKLLENPLERVIIFS